MSEAPRLSLYTRATCGYCAQVNAAARSLGIELEQRDISDPTHRRALTEAMGRATVPVLRFEPVDADPTADPVPGRWMPESLQIIRHLKARAGHPDPVPLWVDRVLGRANIIGPMVAVAGMFAPNPWGTVLLGTGIAWMAAGILRRLMLMR